jgi:hypothetical protein
MPATTMRLGNLWSVALLTALIGWLPTQNAAGDVTARARYRNNHAGPKTDFHITVSNSGGNLPGTTRLVNRGVNQAGPTAGWQNTPGAANNTNTTADFDAGATGAGVGPNGVGDFFVHNNNNYLEITEAYWTPVERDANNKIIQATSVGQPHKTNYDFSVPTPGRVQFNPRDQAPFPFDFMLVKTGVSVASLAARTDPSMFSNLSFSDFDSLPGTVLERHATGGSVVGPLSYDGPPLTADTGAFIYLQSGDLFLVAWSDGVAVPEPGSIALLICVGTVWLARARPFKPH